MQRVFMFVGLTLTAVSFGWYFDALVGATNTNIFFFSILLIGVLLTAFAIFLGYKKHQRSR